MTFVGGKPRWGADGYAMPTKKRGDTLISWGEKQTKQKVYII